MMKKLTLVLGLFLLCHQFLVAQATQDERLLDAGLTIEAAPALDIIAHYQDGKFELEDADPYFFKTQICWVADSIWYVVSYEPHREGHHYGDKVYDRDLYLYKRKLNSDEKWTKAIEKPLLESHSWYGNIYQSYNRYALNSDQNGGKSSIEFIPKKELGEDVIIIFMGVDTKVEQVTNIFTEMFLIFKEKESNGFVHYNYTKYSLTRDHSGIFPYSNRKGNVFYDTDGYTVSIFSDDDIIGFTYNHPKNGCTLIGNRNSNIRMRAIDK